MYFDETPKSRLADFFDFRAEFNQLRTALQQGARLTVISGLRRTGKTSLILTGLGQHKAPYIFLDGRIFGAAATISRREFFQAVERALNDCIRAERRWWRRLAAQVRRIRGVEVTPSVPPAIHLTWGERTTDAADLPVLLRTLAQVAGRQRRLVLVLDEAQEFRRLAGYDLTKMLAYIYDHVRSVQLIVSGSQVGFLHEFLGAETARSPLFGRQYVEIRLRHLTRDEARRYLVQGCRQLGLRPEATLLNHVVENLNGIIGWLTYVGAQARYRKRLDENILAKALTQGAKLAAEELEHFLAYRQLARRRYVLLLRRLAVSGAQRWADLKRSLEAEEGRKLSPTVFNELLRTLVEASFVHKVDENYAIADPLVAAGVREDLTD